MKDEPKPLHQPAAEFVRSLGVVDLAPATVPFDPGYDLATVEGHLAQSHHLIARFKLSMACWLIGAEAVTRAKLAAAQRYGIPVVSGGGPFEIAAAQGQLNSFLDLCAEFGFSRIEAGEGFTRLSAPPEEIVALAQERGLEVQFELGDKHAGSFTGEGADALLDQGRRWLAAGAAQLVIEARESAAGIGLFSESGALDRGLADRFAETFGLDTVVFEAPTKPSQFALMDHFGPAVLLTNVRLEEILRVEIYRRGLHSDAFLQPTLRPQSLTERPLPADRTPP